MLRAALAAAALTGIAACSRPASGAPADAAADEAAIRAILDSATAAHAAGDAQRLAALFTDDAVFMRDGDTAISGRAALEGYIGSVFAANVSTAAIRPVEIQVSGDWAFARTSVSGALTPKDGRPPVQFDLKEIAIYRRQADGRWKVARLIGNGNRPAAPPR